MNGTGSLGQVSSFYFIAIHFNIYMLLQRSSDGKTDIIGTNGKRIMTAFYQYQ